MQVNKGFDFIHSSAKIVVQYNFFDFLIPEVDRFGCRNILLLTSPSVSRALDFCADTVFEGRRLLRFAEVPNHSSIALVEDLTRRASEVGIDGIVVIGGGSVIDTGKAVAMCLAEGLPLERHASRFIPPDKIFTPILEKEKIPVFAVPTTASAAEVAPGLGAKCDRTGSKLLFRDFNARPRVIFLDGALALSTPMQIMQESLMNALAHCVESIYSKMQDPLSQAFALQGIEIIVDSMVNIANSPDSIIYRRDALIGAHLSGLCILNSRVGIHHAICHSLGSVGGLSHGQANAVILPHAIRFNATHAQRELAIMARHFAPGAPIPLGRAPLDAILERVASLQAVTGVATRLRDTGLSRSKLSEIAEETLGDRGVYFNPRQISDVGEILEILDAAW